MLSNYVVMSKSTALKVKVWNEQKAFVYQKLLLLML